MILIVGLGNPGKEYENTRHNVGKNLVTRAAANLKFQHKPKLSADIAQGDGVIFAVPDSYMNLSGFSVQKIMSFFKITPDHLYVVHDDLDLPVGEYRLQFDRGPAGHNGVKSIIEQIGTQAFQRVRIGIDHPRNSPNPQLPVEDYVLQAFMSVEKPLVDRTIAQAVENLKSILSK